MTKKLLNIILFLTLAATAAGQESLRNDAVYDSLVNRRTKISAHESVIESLLESARQRFSVANESEKANMQAHIIDLETRLFRLRDSLSATSVEINELESRRMVENIGKTPPRSVKAPVVSEQNPNFVYNSIFRETLPAEYYRQLTASQEKEQQVDEIILRLREKYSELTDIVSVYMIADKKQADSLFNVFPTLTDSTRMIADSMAAMWHEVYDTKLFLYNWLLSNRHPDLLPGVEREVQDVRRNLAKVAEEGYMYPALAAYPYEKNLVIHYEMNIADREGLETAKDSLRKVSAELLYSPYLLRPIVLEERMYFDFADIAVSQPSKYNANNPIPKTEIHPKGTIYRILLGAYSKPQPVSIFRGVYPLSVEHRDGKYHYFAGGFATADEAEEARLRAKKYGFSNPQIIMWKDGECADIEIIKTVCLSPIPMSVRYRVEIVGTDDGLSESIREVIAVNAKGKEISRVVNPESGAVIFTVGSFDDIKVAQKLADAVNADDGTATANVIKL